MNKSFFEKMVGIKNGIMKVLRPVGRMLSKAYAGFKKLPAKQRQIILVVLIIAAGVAICSLLVLMRKKPMRVERDIVAPLVKVERVWRQDVQMTVEGYGVVQPKVEVDLVPQVSGKIVGIDVDFRNGGFIRAGHALITIDRRDYELAVQRARADVAKAEVALDIEVAEADVSHQQWEQLNPGKEPNSALVFRGPQVRQAQAMVEAAKAELMTAKLHLERTEVSVPFDGCVVSEAADLGQYVTAGRSIGKVYGIAAVEIEVPLEDSELAWFDIRSNSVTGNGSDNVDVDVGSEVLVRSRFAGGEHSWPGRVVRTTGQVDRASRLVSVVVEVLEPFARAEGRPALVPGMFVEVSIKGKVIKGVMPVVRSAIHGSDKVWVVSREAAIKTDGGEMGTDEGQLYIAKLEIVRRDKVFAYVVSGLDDGCDIVVSSLDIVTEGMAVRMESGGDEK